MYDSENRRREQKTSHEDRPGKDRLEAERVPEVPRDTKASCEKKARPVRSGLLGKILSDGNMNDAVRRVEKNKGASGVDRMEVENLRPYLMEHGRELANSIREGRFKPNPVRRVNIPKPDGGTRALGIPTVVDRVVQQAIAQELTDIFEPLFSEYSYGFRPGRSAHDALKQAKEYISESRRYVVDMDLKKFFDTVNHDILMHLISRVIKDKAVLKLIRSYLTAGVMERGIVTVSKEGTPQGGPLSPLLSNIMLTELDRELERRGHKFCRYADDCNIYVKSRRAGERVFKSIKEFVETKLKLKVNEDKSAVAHVMKRQFLGYAFYFKKQGVQFRVDKKRIKRFKDKLKGLTNRNVSVSFDSRVKKLAQVMRGWINYFKMANMGTAMKAIDEWIRRRLRACIWKTWKKVRTRFRSLTKLGIPRGKAWEWANTRKGYWRISCSPILHHAISNELLAKRGYLSAVSLYAKYKVA